MTAEFPGEPKTMKEGFHRASNQNSQQPDRISRTHIGLEHTPAASILIQEQRWPLPTTPHLRPDLAKREGKKQETRVTCGGGGGDPHHQAAAARARRPTGALMALFFIHEGAVITAPNPRKNFRGPHPQMHSN